jgi:hypothetical protein
MQRLTDQQRAVLAAKVGPMAAYLARLLARMRDVQWPTDDELYVHGKQAEAAVGQLRGTLAGMALRPEPEPDRRPWEPGGSGRRP